MKKIITLMAVLGLTFSCSKKTKDTYSYTFQENAELTILPINEDSYMKNSTIENGNNIVFTYEYIADDAEIIADDEYSEIIRFEIEPGLTEFNYTDEELSAISTVYSEYCFCAFFDESKNTSPKGSISGKKISETQWDITIDVIFYTDDIKYVSNVFTLKEN
ncbi:hypothetical protein GH721_14055 [Kriegella sp. EG-1]|nr:hypothetical protein [Flavobacteriaceae bacterium EG-1]